MIRTGKARHARHGGGSGGHGPLTLIPMIDMLMILVVYLLVHSADTEILPNSRNISIPYSVSDQKPRPATVVTVTRDMLYVNGEAVVSVADVGSAAEPVVEALRAALGQGVRWASSRHGRAARGDRHGREVAAIRRAAQDRCKLLGRRLHQGVPGGRRARAGARCAGRGLMESVR